jgi:hypothetical protein
MSRRRQARNLFPEELIEGCAIGFEIIDRIRLRNPSRSKPLLSLPAVPEAQEVLHLVQAQCARTIPRERHPFERRANRFGQMSRNRQGDASRRLNRRSLIHDSIIPEKSGVVTNDRQLAPSRPNTPKTSTSYKKDCSYDHPRSFGSQTVIVTLSRSQSCGVASTVDRGGMTGSDPFLCGLIVTHAGAGTPEQAFLLPIVFSDVDFGHGPQQSKARLPKSRRCSPEHHPGRDAGLDHRRADRGDDSHLATVLRDATFDRRRHRNHPQCGTSLRRALRPRFSHRRPRTTIGQMNDIQPP